MTETFYATQQVRVLPGQGCHLALSRNRPEAAGHRANAVREQAVEIGGGEQRENRQAHL